MKAAGHNRASFFLTSAVFLTSLIITLVLWRLLLTQEEIQIRRTISGESETITSLIKERLDSRTLALVRMAKRWEARSITPTEEWEADVGLYIAHQPEYRSVQWADSSHNIRWIVSRQGFEPSQDITSEFLSINLKRIESAREEKKPSVLITNPFKDGQRGITIYVPIFFGKEFKGGLLGILRTGELLDPRYFMDDAYGYCLSISDNGREVYRSNPAAGPELEEWSQKTDLTLNNVKWELRIWPYREMLRGSFSSLPGVVLTAGILASILLAMTVHLTQRARNQARALEKTASELMRSNQELEQFAYVASHDLQEPVRKITNFSELFAEKFSGSLDEKSEKYLGYITDGAKRMGVLIQDLLSYSRTGFGEISLVETPFENIINQAKDLLESSIDQSQAVITWESLPVVKISPSPMVLVTQNLLANAIKFRSGNAPRIEISAREDSGFWTFAFKDNGIGIEPQFFHRIFVIFQRLHTRSEYPGTGIGLAICRKVIERHKGTLWVESEPGKGSCFYFTIPQ
ncbi:ATP-binding protein [Fibrobacterota bacterium]